MGTVQPVFAFGHGLSVYHVQLRQACGHGSSAGSSDDVLVTVEITNTGTRAGDEVPSCM